MTKHAVPLVVRIEAPIAWVVVNRPAARNALTQAVWRGLAEEFGKLESESTVRVVVLRGAGDEAFISGADISEFPALRADFKMTEEYDRLTHAALEAIATVSKPVMAMINGLCFGGGCSVALACDLRFAADHARFAIPAARLGLAYPFERGVESLVHVVGPTNAADLLLSTRAISADDALRIGLVNRVVPADQLEAETRDYALRMSECAPLTLAAHKAAIGEAMKPSSERDPKKLRALNRRCFDSEDYREGVAAFLGKRKPLFSGR
ncbi:MAG: enoyl-CoA hydratase/isomerase family protein [Deltaproteobacteria bacterium]|nr:enoyl-CoA hydratase/isomerase family protein [Deltaproteobacteria bacterium]